MKISELSRASGVSIPSIKYYLREGLLQPGAPTGPNQAAYGEPHLRRLRLIRALRDVGGLSIATIGEVLRITEKGSPPALAAIGLAVDALALDATRGDTASDSARAAEVRTAIIRLLRARGWLFRPDAAAVDVVVRACVAAAEVRNTPIDMGEVAQYADAMMRLAEQETRRSGYGQSQAEEEQLQAAVVGTVLSEPMILALRRLALEHVTLQQAPEQVRAAVREMPAEANRPAPR